MQALEELKTKFASPKLCTPELVRTLQDLLEVTESVPNAINGPGISQKNSSAQHARQPPRGSAKVTRKTTASRPHVPVHEDNGKTISAAAKKALATDIINLVLKALSEASSTSSSQQKNLAISTSCLKEFSPNKIPAPSSALSKSKSVTLSTSVGNGIPAIVDAARVAFAFLCQPAQGSEGDAKLYKARVAFVGRLLGLGLNNQAFKELQLLKARLSGPTANPIQKPKARQLKEKELQKLNQCDVFKDLFTINVSFIDQSSKLAELFDFQSLGLRLLANESEPAQINSILDLLDPSHASSPTVTLSKLCESPGFEEKGSAKAQQLSQILLHIASKRNLLESNLNTTEKSANHVHGATVRFRLQTFAILTRLILRDKSNKGPEICEEELQQYARFLGQYEHSSGADSNFKWEFASRGVSSLEQNHSNTHGSEGSCAILEALSRIAQDAGREKDVKTITERLIFQHGSLGLAAHQVPAWRLRLQTVSFNLAFSSKDLKAASRNIKDAIRLLNDSFKTKSTNQSALFREVNQFRKATDRCARTICTGSDKAENDSTAYRRDIFEGLGACLMYLEQYVSSLEKISDHDHEKLLALKMIRPFLDSALHALRYASNPLRLTSQDILDVLGICRRLLGQYEGLITVNRLLGAKDPYTSLLNNFGEVSWHIAVVNKNLLGKDILQVMMSSCDILESVGLGTRTSESLPSKLHILGLQMSKLQENCEALRILWKAAEVITRSQHPTGRCAKRTLGTSVDLDESESLLRNVFKAGLKIVTSQRHKNDITAKIDFFDLVDIDVEIRGHLLELQLSLLLEDVHANWKDLSVVRVLKDMFSRLLQLYDNSTFPIRRRRILFRIMKFLREHEVSELEEFRLVCLECARTKTTSFGDDNDMIDAYDHLQASLEISCAMNDPTAQESRQMILSAISTWNKMFGNPTNLVSASAWFDLEDWIHLLFALLDLFEAFGDRTITEAVLLTLHQSREGITAMPLKNQLSIDSRLCRYLLDMEHLDLAAIQLRKCEQHDKTGNAMAQGALLELTSNKLESCRQRGVFDEGDLLLDQLKTELDEPGNEISGSHVQNNGDRHLETIISKTDALRKMSDFLFETGEAEKSTHYLKRASRILQSCLTTLKKKQSPEGERGQAKDDPSDRQALSPVKDCRNWDAHSFTLPLWLLAGKLLIVNTRLAEVYAFCDQLRGTYSAMEHVNKMVQNFKGSKYVCESWITQGQITCRQGELERGHELLLKTSNLINEQFKIAVSFHTSIGQYHHLKCEWPMEMRAYEDAIAQINSFKPTTLFHQLSHDRDTKETLDVSFSKLTLTKKSNRQGPRTTSRPSNKSLTKTKKISHAPNQEDLAQLFNRSREEVMMLKAESLLEQRHLKEAQDLLAKSTLLTADPQVSTECHVLLAQVLIQSSLASMAVNPMFSSLPESTIAYPATVQSVRKLSLSDKNRSGLSHDLSSKSQPHIRRPSSRNSASSKFSTILDQGLHYAETATGSRKKLSHTYIRRNFGSMALASMLLSFSGLREDEQPSRSATFAQCLDLPAIVATNNDQRLAEIDAIESCQRSGSPVPVNETSYIDFRRMSLPDFQAKFVDSIPETWLVISMNLDEGRDHLLITRYVCDRIPFIVRLPLKRQGSDDVEELAFSFQDAFAELLDIKKSSDDTVQRARENAVGLAVKGAKTKWWNEREALDNRLHDLLLNVEKVWFGGFRGILSHDKVPPDMLAEFKTSFDNILRKHLPSRKSSRKRGSSIQVKLNDPIYELFTNVGDFEDPDDDLEEILTDLLYFVVDMLQFNGEANAYDEIDFDSIIVDILDALNTHRESVAHSKTSSVYSHTILVLDRPLHIFPWESLPSLQNRSVSRLPSLLDLHDRIVAMRQQSHESKLTMTNQTLSASRSGSYILNPSGDLTKTQSRFEKSLSSLSSTSQTWHSISNRIPSESDFSTALSPHSKSLRAEENTAFESGILLYFGHGPGTQYIRPRKIARMRFPSHKSEDTSASNKAIQNHAHLIPNYPTHPVTCNTALLFGCSSASLTHVGDFEPYGTPKTYLMAGAPAILGSLWDVTDGDVDRFAGATLEGWGLFEEGQLGWEKWGRGRKEKGCSHPKRAKGQTWDLSMAVSVAREGCYLRWLNGAAMVVYGVPVSLE